MPLAGLAALGARKLDRRLGAARGLLEADLEVVAQIGALLRAAAPAAAAEQIAKTEDVAESAEDVLEADEDGRDRTRRSAPAHAGMAEPIVQAARFCGSARTA